MLRIRPSAEEHSVELLRYGASHDLEVFVEDLILHRRKDILQEVSVGPLEQLQRPDVPTDNAEQTFLTDSSSRWR